MSNLIQTYQRIKPAVVAIASRFSKSLDFPEIIGTGFIARHDGIIFTNKHVIEHIEKKLPRVKGSVDWPAVVLYCHTMPNGDLALVSLDIKGVTDFQRDKPVEGNYYGPDIPDLAIIHVEAKNLPSLTISSQFNLLEGSVVAVAGFPLGTTLLRASEGWIHQISPTLQTGIISAILPFSCNNPHAFLFDVVAVGGSSGSPVFCPESGEVFGILYAGFNGTSLTYAVLSNVIFEIFRMLDQNTELKVQSEKYDSIEEILKKRNVEIMRPRSAEGMQLSKINKGQLDFSPPRIILRPRRINL